MDDGDDDDDTDDDDTDDDTDDDHDDDDADDDDDDLKGSILHTQKIGEAKISTWTQLETPLH